MKLSYVKLYTLKKSWTILAIHFTDEPSKVREQLGHFFVQILSEWDFFANSTKILNHWVAQQKKGFAAGWILTVIIAIIWYDCGDFPNADLVINTKSYIIDILKVLPKVIIFRVSTTTIFMIGKLIIVRLLNFANIFTLNFSKLTQVSVYEQLR